MSQFTERKSQYPKHIILMRVGEFYQAVGMDAIWLIEFARTSPDSCKNDVQTSVHHKKIQAVISCVVRNKFSLAIFEESEVLRTPRERYLSQIVDESVPIYDKASDAYDHDVIDAKPFASVHPTIDGVSICLVYIQQRVCRILHKLTDLSAEALLQPAREPILVFRTPPKWLKNVKVDYAGIDPRVSLMERTLVHVCHEYKIKSSDFRLLTIRNGRCGPLSTFTLNQLGLSHEVFGVPSLLTACLPKDAPKVIQNELKQWLLCPPCEQMAESFKTTLFALITDKQSLPKFLPAQQSHRVQQLKMKQSNAKLLREIRINVNAFLNVDFASLKSVLFDQFGTTQCDIEAVQSILADTLEDEESCLEDARGISKSFCVHVKRHLLSLSNYFEANDKLIVILARYDKDQIVKDSKSIHFFGRPNAKDKLAVPEKKNPNIHTTAEVLEAELEMKMAYDAVEEQQREVLANCCTNLEKLEAALHVIENFALILVTLWYHARLAQAKKWSMCEHGTFLHIREMRQ